MKRDLVHTFIALPRARLLLMQDLVQQIARQRDMFRRLLQDAASVSGRAGAAGDLQLIASADAQLASNSALQVSG